MTSHETISAYPLAWPLAWPRTPAPRRAPFSAKVPKYETRADGSSYSWTSHQPRSIDKAQREPDDRGAAAYFFLDGPRVLACDRWDRIADNLWAIKLHIESVRGQERWGVGSIAQAFAGYQALSAQAGVKPPHEVLGLAAPARSRDEIDRAFKIRARECHPDAGGDNESWLQLQEAREIALRALPEVSA